MSTTPSRLSVKAPDRVNGGSINSGTVAAAPAAVRPRNPYQAPTPGAPQVPIDPYAGNPTRRPENVPGLPSYIIERPVPPADIPGLIPFPTDPIDTNPDPVFSSLTQILVRPMQGGSWGPYVEVKCRDFPGQLYTVWRSWADRKVEVRPLIEVPGRRDKSLRDYEAPFDTPITYTLEDLAGRVHASATTTLGSYDPDIGWIHPVLNPSHAVQVEWMAASFPTVKRPTTGTLLYVQGGSAPHVVNGGIRRGATDMQLAFRVYSRAEEAKLERMLGAFSTARQVRRAPTAFCLRSASLIPLSGSTIVNMPEVIPTRTENKTRYFFTDFAAQVTEINPPALGRRIEQLTYATTKTRFATYDQAKARYAGRDYADAQLDYTGLEP